MKDTLCLILFFILRTFCCSSISVRIVKWDSSTKNINICVVVYVRTMVMCKVGWDETRQKIQDWVGFRIASCVRIRRVWSACAVLLQELLPNILYTVPCSKFYCQFDIDQIWPAHREVNRYPLKLVCLLFFWHYLQFKKSLQLSDHGPEETT